MQTSTVRRVVRASAVYDLITTAGFALPWTAPGAFALIGAIHRGLGLSGALPGEDVYTLLFANLMGSIVTVWAVLRILRPEPVLGAADTAGRALFALGMCAALAAGASPVLAGFAVLEVAWALVQGGTLLAWRRTGRAGGVRLGSPA